MKKIVILGMILCMLVGNVGCNTSRDRDNQNNIIIESSMDKSINEIICKKIQFNEENELDINNDGNKDTLLISASEVKDNGNRIVSIVVNSVVSNIVETESYGDAYLIKNDNGNIAILFESWWSNDYCITYSCQIDKNMKVSNIDEVEGNIVRNTVTKDAVVIENVINLFGTWYGTREYNIMQDFKLVPKANTQIKNRDKKYITLKDDLMVMRKEDGKWCDYQCQKNERLYPKSTDNIKYMYFKTSDGKGIRLEFSMNDYQVFVDGVAIEELFDGVEIIG